MDAMNNTITSGNTIKIEGGTYLPIHFEPKAPRPDPEQFVQYEYPLHNQLPSTEDVSTAAEGEASTTESSQGATNDTTFTISSIRSLDANVYPWDRIDSDSVSSIRVIELQHDITRDQRALPPHQKLMTDINNFGRDQHGDQGSALDLDFTLDKTFRHRVSLRGTITPERLRLLVCIPHFSSRKTSNGETSSAGMGTTLAEYRNTITGSAPESSATSPNNTGSPLLPGLQLQISVNQTCFMVVNSEMIIMVRTASNEQSSLLPFFPGQHRACVLHLLVNMISTVLQFSTQATFGAISDQYLAFEGRIQSFINDNTSGQGSRENRLRLNEGRQINIKFDNLLLDTRTVIHLVQSQIQSLKEFYGILTKGYHYYAPYSKGYHTDAIKLPMRLQNQRSLKIAIEELKTSITERETFRGEFQALHKRGRKSQSSLLRSLEQQDVVSAVEQLSNGRVSQILSVIDTRVARICDAIGRGSTNVKEQTDLAKQQAETMSMFTVITTLFLPLTFFTSYFALEPGKSFVTQNASWKFWVVAAPVTFVFTVATLYIVLMKKFFSGEYQYNGQNRLIRRMLRIPNPNTGP